ncbi:DNA-binding transcriptional regulator, CsgD family [Enterovibrio norvegicus DSM 15893]|uniref:DNA-binding transcriptional regulator, CsgD family n=3 Tax=Enterovibrio norvegicus TaxID=188144 RepID=A0A1I5WSX6_9GAMM|nr:DNA-binding transcriptional regulator, CsgD family [Enterovibrio norvegicus DSM 15893]
MKMSNSFNLALHVKDENVVFMDTDQLYAIIEELDGVQNKEQLESLCEQFCKLVEIPYYLFGVIEQESLYAPVIHTFTNYPAPWLEKYFQQNKQRVDPVVSYIMTQQAPIRWDSLVQREEFQAPQQQELMALASQYGLCNGFTVPIKSASGDFVLLSMAIGDVENQCEKLNAAIPFAHTLATHLLECYLTMKIKNQGSEEVSLTKRETDCLFWASEGKTAWEISKIINVSERTVLFHLNNCTKKLAASNRQHAVALAIKKGLLKPNL